MFMTVKLVFSSSLAVALAASESTTNSGCTCESKWNYNGERFSGVCGNPDDDIRGPWCFINKKKPCTGACFNEPFGSIDGRQYDHCPNWNDPDEAEVIPGELLGRWTGDSLDVGGEVNSVTSSLLYMCAMDGSPRLKFKDSTGTQIHIIKQIVCTGNYQGYFYSEIQGQTRCNKFNLELSRSPSRKLTLVSHLEGKPYDCSPLDDLDSRRSVVELSSVDSQVNDIGLLCQPRAPPPELIGSWEGIKSVQMSDAYDNMVATCVVTVRAIQGSSGLMIRSEECTGATENSDSLKQDRTDIIFDAHIDQCQTEGSTTSKGTLLAYTEDGREICYRYVRSTDGSLKMAYQDSKHPGRNHHTCPDLIKLSRDVTVLNLNLQARDGGISHLDWMCTKSTGRLSLVPAELGSDNTETKEEGGSDVSIVLIVVILVLSSCAFVAAFIKLILKESKTVHDFEEKQTEIVYSKDNEREII